MTVVVGHRQLALLNNIQTDFVNNLNEWVIKVWLLRAVSINPSHLGICAGSRSVFVYWYWQATALSHGYQYFFYLNCSQFEVILLVKYLEDLARRTNIQGTCN